MITVSLCMIVKNEEDVLARCLESVSDLVDEIIIVDTGSADRTREIAEQFTSRVYDFTWIDDFAAARNYAFSLAEKDYCMWLDADDVILDGDRAAFEMLKEALDPGVNVVMAKYNTGFDEDGNVTFSYYRERLIKNHAGMRWEGAVHEAVAPVGRVVYSEFAVTHRKLRPSDPDRNLRIYESQLARGGWSWSPGSSSITGGSCTTTSGITRPSRSLSVSWTRAGAGWRTTSTPAATAPTAMSGWSSRGGRCSRCCAALHTTGPAPRCAVSWAAGFSSGSGSLRPPTGIPWR